MSREIYKVVISFPLLARGISADDLRRKLGQMTLDELLYEINEGEMIGGTRELQTIEHVPAEEVKSELLAIGNDGTFFEDNMDEIDADQYFDAH